MSSSRAVISALVAKSCRDASVRSIPSLRRGARHSKPRLARGLRQPTASLQVKSHRKPSQNRATWAGGNAHDIFFPEYIEHRRIDDQWLPATNVDAPCADTSIKVERS